MVGKALGCAPSSRISPAAKRAGVAENRRRISRLRALLSMHASSSGSGLSNGIADAFLSCAGRIRWRLATSRGRDPNAARELPKSRSGRSSGTRFPVYGDGSPAGERADRHRRPSRRVPASCSSCRPFPQTDVEGNRPHFEGAEKRSHPCLPRQDAESTRPDSGSAVRIVRETCASLA